MITKNSRINIALPAMDELENFQAFLHCLDQQSFRNFKLWVCVNQPDEWWSLDEKKSICKNNMQSLKLLKSIRGFELEIIDKCSPGKGWKGKKTGVGWARKTLMDAIAEEAAADDLIVSLDVDTTFSPQYLDSIIGTFLDNPRAVALSVPYYHQLTGENGKDRAILRYEIFMRYYVLNLWRIMSPYSFTAIGSAIALPMKSYLAIGGITPHKSGEDFYFLQKLRKYGKILTRNSEKVYPAARYSNRVGFGTGPAMIKGNKGDWASYPIYPFGYFDEIKKTYDLFPDLYFQDMDTSLDTFIKEKFGGKNIWSPLRQNAGSQKQFVRSCYHKLDAFRMLQYLKWRSELSNAGDEESLKRWIVKFYPEQSTQLHLDGLSFESISIEDLNQIRDFLVAIESNYQKKSTLPDI